MVGNFFGYILKVQIVQPTNKQMLASCLLHSWVTNNLTSFCLGDGSYSKVYQVKRYKDEKIYALKQVKLQNLSDREKDAALNEVRLLASI